jgi:hypothetical protein
MTSRTAADRGRRYGQKEHPGDLSSKTDRRGLLCNSRVVADALARNAIRSNPQAHSAVAHLAD